MLVYFSIDLCLTFWNRVSHEPKAFCFCLAGWSVSSQDPPVFTWQILGIQSCAIMPSIYMGSGGLNTGLSCLYSKNFIDLSVFPATSLTYTVTTNKLINNSICYRSYSRSCMVLEFKICSLFSELFPQLSLCLESHNPSVYGSCTILLNTSY